jgi:hypothetical protein
VVKWAKHDTWGDWHTSREAPTVCPQGCYRVHSVEEAARLNEQSREYRRAVLYESMRRWREHE